ncbi:tartrate transporter [Apiospora hydei]|uniref:Tartrate transporter n=1 Tax=Apiospora hydei TaxID=1337664 RepID=A0ABR1UVX3_9PEZI
MQGRASITADDDVSKPDTKHVDEACSKPVGVHTVATPESLRGMAEDELKKLEKKMVRKVDFVILPIMTVLYILNYVDRSALAASKVYGITKDLNMSEHDFATAISILFVGYIPFQIPSNLIITKVSRPGLCKLGGP